MIVCGIYKITNILNNKCYIGSSKNMKRREYIHFYKLKKNEHHCHHLQNAYNKYGKENFIFEPMIDCKEEELNCYEDYFLAYYKPEYNILKSSSKRALLNKDLRVRLGNGNRGRKFSIEVRKNMSEGHKNKTHSLETKAKMSKASLGKKKSDEARRKMSESKKKLFRKVLKYQIHDINTNTTYQESTYVDLSKILNISEESVSKIVNGNLNVRKYIKERYIGKIL